MSPIPPSDEAKKTARQLQLFKIVTAALLVLVVAGAAGLFWVRRLAVPVCILVDGNPVATAANPATADSILREAELTLTHNAYPADSIVRLQDVRFARLDFVSRFDAESSARAKLIKKLKLHVRGYAILVDGTPALVLPSDTLAADTLHKVKEHFASLPPPADIVGEPEFVERVEVKQQAVDVSRAFADANQAAQVFYAPVAGKTYTVKKGDTGLVIAIRQHVSLSHLRESNPGTNLDRLRVGDKLNVQKGAARLLVRVRKRFSRDEPVMANLPPAEAGLRRVTYVVTYINGAEDKRDVENISVLTPPRARSVL